MWFIFFRNVCAAAPTSCVAAGGEGVGVVENVWLGCLRDAGILVLWRMYGVCDGGIRECWCCRECMACVAAVVSLPAMLDISRLPLPYLRQRVLVERCMVSRRYDLPFSCCLICRCLRCVVFLRGTYKIRQNKHLSPGKGGRPLNFPGVFRFRPLKESVAGAMPCARTPFLWHRLS